MQNLIEKIGTYNNCVQGLLDKIEEYVELVKKEIPQEFWHMFNVKDAGNSQFTWIAAYVDDEDFGEKLIPVSVEKCGKGQYAYGDFNCWRNFATRKEVVSFAKELPALMKKADAKIQQLLEEAQAVA